MASSCTGLPEQMKLPFALWSRPAIKALVKAQFGLDMQDRLIGKYLKRWGFIPFPDHR